ncbi:NAD(P)-dependent oxidoreductase [Alicyclobacillus acidoterrestris]|uniref:dTDP-4-dehydrorhamnose reductase family protein n=1 Tax=Alicyclobacillus suci TaxID=2816080 RepID=UPI001191A14A|nr:SDR family oxidoreductase [Alicyclobacillus suci]GEO27732.1 NAD(P)-dependent oxidoreductase [Alicyclobacillus acidoterrestris]
MKLLIFGGAGMAGHVLSQYFRDIIKRDVWVTERSGPPDARKIVLDVRDHPRVEQALKQVQPDVVVNAVGLLNQVAEENVKDAIYINSLFPHLLAEHGTKQGFKLVHISTDCVFSGRKGDYTERDIADGDTVYARTKALGEVTEAPHVTIRTSIIGPEKKDGIGLFHWFTRQTGEVKGYTNVFWNGVTTLELAKATKWILDHDLTGLIHLAAPQKVSKYALLSMIQEIFERQDIHLTPTETHPSDKSLVNTRPDVTYNVPDYQTMLEEMKAWMTAHRAAYEHDSA